MTKRKTAPVLLEDKETGGRKRAFINKEVLKALATIGATQEEICAGLVAVGCTLNVRTLKRRLQEDEFREIVEQGQAELRLSLRRLQLRHAKMPNSAGVQMTIHLSKHVLGQTEKAALELSGKVDSHVEVSSARDRVFRKLDNIAERIARRVDGIAVAAGATTASKQPVGS